MVQFTPYEEPKKDPNFAYSRELDAPKTGKGIGSLLEGVGDLFNLTTKVWDTANKESLNDELKLKINTARNKDTDQYKELTGAALLGAVPGPGEPSGASGELLTTKAAGVPFGSENSPQALPRATEDSLRYMDKITQARHMGKLNDVSYYGEMQSITQNLVSRFPGYEDYIRQRAASLLGVDSANAQRESLQAGLAQLLKPSAEDKAEDRWTKEVMKDYAQFAGPAHTRAMLNATTDKERDNWRVFMSEALYDDQKLKTDHAKFNNELSGGKVDEQTSLRMFHNTAANLFSSTVKSVVFESNGYKPGWEGIMDRTEALQNDPTNTGAREALGADLGKLKLALTGRLDQEASRSQFKGGASYNSLIDSGKLEGAKKQYVGMLDEMIKQVGEGHMYSATAIASNIKSMNETNGFRLMANKNVATIAALEGLFKNSANAIFQNMNIQGNFRPMNEVGNLLLQDNMLDVVKPTATAVTTAAGTTTRTQFNLERGAEKFTAAARENPKLVDYHNDYNIRMINDLTQVVVNKNVDTGTKVNAAIGISDPENLKFFEALKVPNRFEAFSALYSPEVTQWIKGTSAGKNATVGSTKVWDDYKSTGALILKMTVGDYIDSVANSISSGGIAVKNIHWNEKTQQIDYDKKNPNAASTPPEVSALTKVNQALRTYGNVLKEDKEEYTRENLKAIGLDFNREATNPTIQELLRTLRSIPSIDKTEENNTNQGNPKGSIRSKRSSIDLPSDVLNSAIKSADGRHYVQVGGQWYSTV